MSKQKPVCYSCGSDDVLGDAYTEWNLESQRWEVLEVFDKGAYCNACQCETRLDWVDVERDHG